MAVGIGGMLPLSNALRGAAALFAPMYVAGVTSEKPIGFPVLKFGSPAKGVPVVEESNKGVFAGEIGRHVEPANPAPGGRSVFAEWGRERAKLTPDQVADLEYESQVHVPPVEPVGSAPFGEVNGGSFASEAYIPETMVPVGPGAYADSADAWFAQREKMSEAEVQANDRALESHFGFEPGRFAEEGPGEMMQGVFESVDIARGGRGQSWPEGVD